MNEDMQSRCALYAIKTWKKLHASDLSRLQLSWHRRLTPEP